MFVDRLTVDRELFPIIGGQVIECFGVFFFPEHFGWKVCQEVQDPVFDQKTFIEAF